VFTEKNEVDMDAMLGTALIDMYGKCRCVDMAFEIFSQIIYQNVFVCTATIAANSMEGHALEATSLYLEMEERGVKPDHETFIALLTACSHGGLVDKGYKVFQQIGCMVGLLGRVGSLEETVKFIERMPTEPDALYGVP
jgi:pentatricopeptide repeat protein